MATSPTPSEDNRLNARDDSMNGALEKVMRNTEQSYDDFINGFTFLKPEDLNKDEKKKTSVLTAVKVQTNNSAGGLLPVPQQINVKTSNNSHTERERLEKQTKTMEQKSDVEEETLCDGDKTSRMSGTKIIRTGKLVKFDNYIEDENVEDVDEEKADWLHADAPGYSASFSQGSRTNDRSRSNGDVQQTARSYVDTNNELPESLDIDEDATDKLLMNFLADLQNEENEGKNIKTSQPTSADNSLDIEKFLQSRKKQIVMKSGKKCENKEETNEVTFTDDETDSALSLFEDSINNQIKVLLKPEELNRISKSADEEEEKRTATLTDIYKSVLMDSEGVVQTVSAENTNMDLAIQNKEREEKDILFPGEVESSDEKEGTKNETTLDFTATYKTNTSPDDAAKEVECSNTVEPFHLDEDFDYDNVVLTPKFSAEDMERLKPLLNRQTVVM